MDIGPNAYPYYHSRVRPLQLQILQAKNRSLCLITAYRLVTRQGRAVISFHASALIPSVQIGNVSRIRNDDPLKRHLSITFQNGSGCLKNGRVRLSHVGGIRDIQIQTFRCLNGNLRPFIRLHVFFCVVLLVLPVNNGTFLNGLIRATTTSLCFRPLPIESRRNRIRHLVAINFQATRPITSAIQPSTMSVHSDKVSVPALILLVRPQRQIRSSASNVCVMSIFGASTFTFRLIPSKVNKFRANARFVIRPRLLRLPIRQRNGVLRRDIANYFHEFRFRVSGNVFLQVLVLGTRIFRLYLSNRGPRAIYWENVGMGHLANCLRLLHKRRKARDARIIRAINCLSRSRPSVIARHRRRLARVLYLYQYLFTRSATKCLHRTIRSLNSLLTGRILGVLSHVFNVLRRIIRRDQASKDKARSRLTTGGAHRNGQIRSMELTQAALRTNVYLVNGVRHLNCTFRLAPIV